MALLDRNPQAPGTWRDQLPVTNRYTAGLAGECFFRALQEQGRILGTRCPRCDRLYVPGVAFCERCLSSLDEWVDVGTAGEVHTYTLVYVNYDGSPRERPELVAFIRLGDGGLVHRLGEVEPEAVHIGMLVEAVFHPPSERTGSILDIEYFRPQEG
jgi:uncharacterized OB-fold protein